MKKPDVPVLVLIASVLSFCSGPSEPDQLTVIATQSPPIITGVHVTTSDQPEGTGEIIGKPSYEVSPGSPNAFPNPFLGAFSKQPPIGPSSNPFLTFNNLPETCTLVIVRGFTPEEATQNQTSSFGVPAFKTGSAIVRVLRKNDITAFVRWDLTDESGNYVLSGAYRVNYYGPALNGVKSIDLYLTISVSQYQGY